MEKGTIKFEFVGNNTHLKLDNVELEQITIAVQILIEKLAKLIDKDVMETYDAQKRLYRSFKLLSKEEEHIDVN